MQAKRGGGEKAKQAPDQTEFPGQVVLVFQGGGALGAYQAGVYQAFHEAGVEPDWVIGTSIGAINAAIIAGNSFDHRLERLRLFWDRLSRQVAFNEGSAGWMGLASLAANFGSMTFGVPGLFSPNLAALWGVQTPVGPEKASFYSAEPLRDTLGDVVDFEQVASGATRLTVGAVNVRSGDMRYFDSRDMAIGLPHILGSSALPPAFPAICIDGDYYWDGGLYSNTPIEAVFDDHPRRDSVVFAVQVWQPAGPAPDSIWQVLGRQKDIQYASRSKSHVVRQEQLHHYRHIVRELVSRLPKSELAKNDVQALADFGCGTTMHIIRLQAPRLDHETHMKDIDFSKEGIAARWNAGVVDARNVLARKAWQAAIDPAVGVAVY
jgi:NTE family protein